MRPSESLSHVIGYNMGNIASRRPSMEPYSRSTLPHRRPAFRVSVEGGEKNLHPILPDEIYKIAAEALRNAFRHSQARQIEVEIRYDNEQFRLRVRDDGKGMGPAILSSHGSDG